MMFKRWIGSILLLLIGMFIKPSGAFVGVKIGTSVSNLPSALEIAAVLEAHQINNVLLCDADAHMFKALANSSIEVMVGVANEEILGIGQSPSAAATWINKNVAPYLPSTNITAIAVGNEVIMSMPRVSPVLVPAINEILISKWNFFNVDVLFHLC